MARALSLLSVLLLCLVHGTSAQLGLRKAFKKLRDRFKGQGASGSSKDPPSSAGECEEAYPAGTAALVEEATALFQEAFKEAPTLAAQAPGRVNLIGEHTDYTGGFVLPLALDKRTVVVATGSIVPVDAEDSLCSVMSAGYSESPETFDANPAVLSPGEPFWTNYVKGVVKQYTQDLPEGHKFAFKAVFASNVPLGAGLSSSAAIEVAMATLLEEITRKPTEGPAKALRCQAAEHEYAAMPCGVMDQFVSSLAVEGHLLQIDCRSNTASAVPLDTEKAVILITNSKVKHELSGSEYPDRVKQCKQATELLTEAFPEVSSLRDATIDMLEQTAENFSDLEYRRAKHVISENTRVEATVQALAATDLEAVGKLMLESHVSLRDDFEVSVPELDLLVELAMGQDGVFGSRMTGGGFGGCTVTLVAKDSLDVVMEYMKNGYYEATGITPDFFVTEPGPGASAVSLPLSSCDDGDAPQRKEL